MFLGQTVQVPVYSEQEYQMYLHDDGWTKAETDHLFDLCKRFDLRFIVIHDRYDHQQYRVTTPSSYTAHTHIYYTHYMQVTQSRTVLLPWTQNIPSQGHVISNLVVVI